MPVDEGEEKRGDGSGGSQAGEGQEDGLPEKIEGQLELEFDLDDELLPTTIAVAITNADERGSRVEELNQQVFVQGSDEGQ